MYTYTKTVNNIAPRSEFYVFLNDKLIEVDQFECKEAKNGKIKGTLYADCVLNETPPHSQLEVLHIKDEIPTYLIIKNISSLKLHWISFEQNWSSCAYLFTGKSIFISKEDGRIPELLEQIEELRIEEEPDFHPDDTRNDTTWT